MPLMALEATRAKHGKYLSEAEHHTGPYFVVSQQ
jgi:hypothetical protein